MGGKWLSYGVIKELGFWFRLVFTFSLEMAECVITVPGGSVTWSQAMLLS